MNKIKSLLGISASENVLLKRLVVFLCLLSAILLGLLVYFLFGLGKTNSLSRNVNKAVELAAEQDAQTKKLVQYSAPKEGYELTFDPVIWKEAGTTRLSEDQNADAITLELREQYGYGRIHFMTLGLGNDISYQADTYRNKYPDSKFDDLDILVEAEITRINSDYRLGPTYSEQLVKKEKININGRDMYRLTLSRANFPSYKNFPDDPQNQKSKYVYRYMILGVKSPVDLGSKFKDDNNDFKKGYVVDAQYTDIGDSKNLVENLIGSFKFVPTVVGNGPFIHFPSASKSAEIKGVSTATQDTSKLDGVQLVELVKPSVVNILNITCDRITVNSQEQSHYLKSSYKFCSAATGSGFIISKDGYVATNGHVAKFYPEEALVMNLQSAQLDPFLIDLWKELVYQKKAIELSDSEATLTLDLIRKNPEQLNILISAIYGLLDEKLISLSEDASKYFVKLGNEPLLPDIDKARAGDWLNLITPSATILEASVVDFNFPNQFTVDSVLNNIKPQGSDVAILKLDNPKNISFPALKIGSSKNLKEGIDIVVIGYPGLVSGDDGLIDSQVSAGKPTITRGIISSIKTDQGGRELIQTDASIDHGNSGGPAFNSKGEVIGIATYGFTSGSGNFNFLRATEDLSELMTKNSIIKGENKTYEDWEIGLTDFWSQKYKKSLTQFNLVKTEYPIHPTVENFISDADTAVKNGEDVEPAILNVGKSGSQLTTGGAVVLVVITLLVVVIIGLGVLVVWMMIKNKKRTQTFTSPNAPPAVSNVPSQTPNIPTAVVPIVNTNPSVIVPKDTAPVTPINNNPFPNQGRI